MCGGRSSILHYGPLIETNYLYAPTPNGQSLSASLNNSNAHSSPSGIQQSKCKGHVPPDKTRGKALLLFMHNYNVSLVKEVG